MEAVDVISTELLGGRKSKARMIRNKFGRLVNERRSKASSKSYRRNPEIRAALKRGQKVLGTTKKSKRSKRY